MRHGMIRWGSRLVTGAIAIVVAIAVGVVIPSVFGSTVHSAAAQIVCVDSPFLGFFDEDEDGVLSLDEVLAVSDANEQLADVAIEMQERGITGFRYADCDPEAVPTGAPDEPEPTAAPEQASTPAALPTPTPSPTATTPPAAADEEEGPLVVTTLPGVGHGPHATRPPVAVAIAGATALLLTIAFRRSAAGTP